MSKRPPCLCIYTTDQIESDPGLAPWSVKAEHYASLKYRLMRNEHTWLELDSVYGDGKIFIHTAHIREMVLLTESYIEAVEDANEADDTIERLGL